MKKLKKILIGLIAFFCLQNVFATTGAGSYATSGIGNGLNSLWWLSWSGYNDRTAQRNGQNYKFSLPNNAGNITTTVYNASQGNGSFQVVAEPAWSGGGAFGHGAYNGIAGNPIFYWLSQPSSPGTVYLYPFNVTDGGGNFRNFGFYLADGENTDFGEYINYYSNQNLNLMETLNNYPSYNGTIPNLSGLGTTQITESGNSGNNYNASFVFGNNIVNNGFTWFANDLTNNEGVLYAISLPKITVNLNVVSRINTKDQFKLSLGYTNPNYTTNTLNTSGFGTHYTTNALSVLGYNNIAVNISMLNGSQSNINKYQTNMVCINNGPGASSYGGTNTILPSGSGYTFNMTPQTGDNISCTLTIGQSLINHYEIEFNPSNSGLTCQPTSVIVRACSDSVSPCVNSVDQSTTSTQVSVTSNLGSFSNGTNTTNLNFVGSTTDSLSSTTAGTATLSIPNSGVPVDCFSGSSLLTNCQTTFNDIGFIFNWQNNSITSAGSGVVTAGATSQVMKISAVEKSNTSNACVGFVPKNNPIFNISYTDPTTGSVNMLLTPTNSSGSGTTSYSVNTSGTSIPLSWDTNGNAYFTVSYKDAGEININASLNNPNATGSTTLISKPYMLQVYNTTSDITCNNATVMSSNTSQKFCPSGMPFNIKIRGYAIDGTVLPNFGKESVVNQFTINGSLISPTGGNVGTLTNVSTNNSGLLTTGITVNNQQQCSGTDCYSLNSLSWNNVGQIALSVNLANSYFGSGILSNAPYLPIGRFYPYAFTATQGSIVNRSDAVCSNPSSFTYMNEPFQALVTLTAINQQGQPTTNYNSTYFNPTNYNSWGLTANNGSNLTNRIQFISEVGNWNNGILNTVLNLDFLRNTTPDGPYNNVNININPIDSDGVSINNNQSSYLLGTSNFYFGRLVIYNSVGSDILPLPIQLQTQYYNQYGFTTNSQDNCTQLNSSNFSTNNFTQNIQASNITFQYPGVFVNGLQTLMMNKPSGGSGIYNGTFNINYNLINSNQTYLQSIWLPSSTTYTDNPIAKIVLSRNNNSQKVLLFKENF